MRSWPRSSSPGRDRAIASVRRPAFLDDEHLLSFQDDEAHRLRPRVGRARGALHGHGPDPGGRRPGSPRLPRPRGAGGRVPDRHRRRDDLDHHHRAADAASWELLFEIVPSADGRRLAVSMPSSAAQQGVLLDIATAQPVGPYWPESGLVSAALPDGGFLVVGHGQLRRRSATGDQLGPALNLYVGGTAADPCPAASPSTATRPTSSAPTASPSSAFH